MSNKYLEKVAEIQEREESLEKEAYAPLLTEAALGLAGLSAIGARSYAKSRKLKKPWKLGDTGTAKKIGAGAKVPKNVDTPVKMRSSTGRPLPIKDRTRSLDPRGARPDVSKFKENLPNRPKGIKGRAPLAPGGRQNQPGFGSF